MEKSSWLRLYTWGALQGPAPSSTVAGFKGEVTTILLTLHENHTIQNKLTMRSVPDPPLRVGDEKHTSSAARWVWVQDYSSTAHSALR